MATDAEKVKMYREKAKDESIPQEVRNTYLDRANELERKAYEATKGAPPTKLAMGGMPVRGSRTATNKTKKMMGGGYTMPTSPTPPMMSKGGAVKATAVKMNKGGYANCGASMAPAQKGKK